MNRGQPQWDSDLGFTTCAECAKKDAVIAELRRLIQPGAPIRTPFDEQRGFDPSQCACNPARGGSGICGCIRGSQIRC